MAVFSAIATEDAHELDDGAGYSATANPMSVVSSTAAGTRRNMGLYFANVTIPQGSTISSAIITLSLTSTATDDILATIYAQAVDSASSLTSDADVTSRTPLTTATLAVSRTAMGVGAEFFTVTDIVQEIVNRSGWASGNNLFLLFKGDNSATSRTMTCNSEENVGGEPTLDITYTEPVTRGGRLSLMGVG